VRQGYGDFAAFYTAGTLVHRSRAEQLYDPQAQWEVQQEFAKSVGLRRGPLPYVRPPFEALLFSLFAFLSYQNAFLVWSAIKLALLVGSCVLLARASERHIFSPPFEALLLLGFFPLGLDFLQGQDAILLLFLFALCLSWLPNKEFLAGCALALGLFKFHLVVPIALIFLVRKRWRFALGFGCIAAAEIIVSLGMLGSGSLLAYPRYLLITAQNAGAGMTTWYDMPNIRAALWGVSGRDLPAWLAVGIVIFGIMLVAGLWEENSDSSVAFSLAIVTTLLTSYYAYSHDLTLLAIPLLLLQGSFLENGEIAGKPRLLFLVAAAALAPAPLHWFLLLRTKQLYWAELLPLISMALALAWTMRLRGRLSRV
jgi:hypothetical protein